MSALLRKCGPCGLGSAPAARAAGWGRTTPALRPRRRGATGAGGRCRAQTAQRSTRPPASQRAFRTETGAPQCAARERRMRSERVSDEAQAQMAQGRAALRNMRNAAAAARAGRKRALRWMSTMAPVRAHSERRSALRLVPRQQEARSKSVRPPSSFSAAVACRGHAHWKATGCEHHSRGLRLSRARDGAPAVR